jgi:hypothetical protein
MSEFWRWADNSPFLSFLLICSTFYTAKYIIRSINIQARGWPPAHLDADGDIHNNNKEVNK